jgi:RNA polymerase sigma-70 factor (ECF subfamily)
MPRNAAIGRRRRSKNQPAPVLILGVMDQRTLVLKAQAGDVDAFEALVRLASGRLFAIASRILRDHHAAEDAVQQTLVTIWDELPRLRDPDRFDAWTYRVIARASIAQSKRERRGGAVLTLLPDDTDAIATGMDALGGVADRDRLERGFRRLNPDQRAALVLQHYAGLSLAEIADVLGVPPGTVASRIHYATRVLRAAIDADDRAGVATERSA